MLLKSKISSDMRNDGHHSYDYNIINVLIRIAKFSIIYFLFEAYFMGLFATQSDWTTKMQHFKEEYNGTGQSATYFGSSLVGFVYFFNH